MIPSADGSKMSILQRTELPKCPPSFHVKRPEPPLIAPRPRPRTFHVEQSAVLLPAFLSGKDVPRETIGRFAPGEKPFSRLEANRKKARHLVIGPIPLSHPPHRKAGVESGMCVWAFVSMGVGDTTSRATIAARKALPPSATPTLPYPHTFRADHQKEAAELFLVSRSRAARPQPGFHVKRWRLFPLEPLTPGSERIFRFGGLVGETANVRNPSRRPRPPLRRCSR
jgi:hypothetical protein